MYLTCNILLFNVRDCSGFPTFWNHNNFLAWEITIHKKKFYNNHNLGCDNLHNVFCCGSSVDLRKRSNNNTLIAVSREFQTLLINKIVLPSWTNIFSTTLIVSPKSIQNKFGYKEDMVLSCNLKVFLSKKFRVSLNNGFHKN